MIDPIASPTPNNTITNQPLIDTPQVLQTLDQPCAMVPLKVPTSEIGQAMEAALAEIASVLKDQNTPPNGPFYTHHLRVPDTHFDLEVCLPVGHSIEASGRVQPGIWKAETVARVTYEGDYSGLVAAWQEFMAWISTHGHTPNLSAIYERYLVGPNETPDSKQWRTELNIGITH